MNDQSKLQGLASGGPSFAKAPIQDSASKQAAALVRFIPLGIAVLTISDSRDLSSDVSGQSLVKLLEESGHKLIERHIIKDEIEAIRQQVKNYIAHPQIQIVLCTGGTGITNRDVTPEALYPLLDKEIPGFGELFRMLSYQSIGASTIQSRAFAGIADKTLIFALPGSPGACKDAWSTILATQLDVRTKPCNFVSLLF